MLEIIVILSLVLFAEAANDFQIKRVVCENFDKSIIKLECEYKIRAFSFRSNFPKPLNDLKVTVLH
jgi:hypothetical protein